MAAIELIDVKCAWSDDWWAEKTESPPTVRLQLDAGQWCAVIGDNGIGKSTLLHAISGSCPYVSGTIRTFGIKLEPRNVRQRFVAGVHFVPQEVKCAARWDWDDIQEMAFFARPGLRLNAAVAELRRRAVSAGLLKSETQLFTARLARFFTGILSCPNVLLLDEIGSLFPDVSPEDVYLLIRQFAPSAAVVFVEHSFELALSVAQRCLLFDLTERPGAKEYNTIADCESSQIPKQVYRSHIAVSDNQNVEMHLSLLREERTAREHLWLALRASTRGKAVDAQVVGQVREWWPYLEGNKRVEHFSGGMKIILQSVMELLLYGRFLSQDKFRHIHSINLARLSDLETGVKGI